MPEESTAGAYQYSRVEFWHPDPELDIPGVVTLEIVVDDTPLVAGNSVEVA